MSTELVEKSDIQLLLKENEASIHQMSEIEEYSPTFELESIAQEELKRRAREKTAKVQTSGLQTIVKAPEVPPAAEPVDEERPTRVAPQQSSAPPATRKAAAKKHTPRRVSGDKQTRDLVKKHDAERRALQKNIVELAKKKDRDITELMQEVLKDHYAQVDKEREDYVAVLGSLKDSLEGQTKEITTSCQQVVTTAAQDEVERMVNWFHEEFMQELAKKSQMYEDLKISSEKQVNKMSAENDTKSQKIMMLDEKIKELALHLPKNVRQEIFEELGLEHLKAVTAAAGEEKPKDEKAQGKGMFSKLSQLFKRQPSKTKAKPVQGKPKPAKGQQKRPSAEGVIAQ